MMTAPTLERRDLLERWADLGAAGPKAQAAGLTLDSRAVGPGYAFVALAGRHGHGLDYLDAALAGGASAVVVDAHDPRWGADLERRCRAADAAAITVAALAENLGRLAARFFDTPAGALAEVIAVTGTDGKTSVAHFLAAMLDEPGAPAGLLGTLGHGRVGALGAPGLTTPDAIGVQSALAELADAGVRRLALEASSHGLAQYRLDGTRIDVAVLTQLGRDHLDYHADEAAYAAAKARLFTWPDLQGAVLNAGDPFGRQLAERIDPAVAVLTYGGPGGELQAAAQHFEPEGLRFELHYRGEHCPVQVPLLGAFNVDNLLAAAGALLVRGWALAQVAARLARVTPVPGRLEAFRAPGRPAVIVDYAHNAGALAAALAALRDHVRGRIWCIVGAGGDRDRGKRPLMGAAAVAGAERVIVTDDNPRTEDPEAIVNEILAGTPADSGVMVEHDRGRALALAVEQAGPDDAVLLAGKGHEADQVRGERTLAWSDRTAARACLDLDPDPDRDAEAGS